MPRPRQFDIDEALDNAVRQFWDTGYFDTSIDALVATTGVARKSMYTVFGSKRDLFLAALSRYRTKFVDPMFTPLQHRDASLPELEAFFAGFWRWTTTPEGGRGCFLCNSAIELGRRDAEVGLRISQHFTWMRQVFRHVLDNAVANGQLPAGADRHKQASLLVSVFQGLSVMARSNAPASMIRAVVDEALNSLKRPAAGWPTSAANGQASTGKVVEM